MTRILHSVALCMFADFSLSSLAQVTPLGVIRYVGPQESAPALADASDRRDHMMAARYKADTWDGSIANRPTQELG